MRLLVEMLIAFEIEMENVRETEAPAWSVTFTVNFAALVELGVPVIVVKVKFSPAGSLLPLARVTV